MKVLAAASSILFTFFFAGSSLVAGQTLPSGEIQDHLPGLEDSRFNNSSARPKLGPTPEPRVLKKGPLAPAEQDRTAYAGFLKQADTGLVRLLSRPTPAEQPTRRPKMAGGGEHYSFSFLSHDRTGDIDLVFDVVCRGVVGGPPLCQYPRQLRVSHYGMLANLGDVALDELTVNDPRTAFLLGYKPPREASKVRCERIEFHKGVTNNGQLYKTGLPIQVNSTYLLRSTDRRLSDVLVAFRVVREDVDGSVTLAWKLLKNFQPTKIENVLYVNGTDKCPAR